MTQPIKSLLLAVFLLNAPCTSAQQLITGRFYAEKQEYSVGEPIIVDFEVVNGSNETAEIDMDNCAWLFHQQFEVDGAAPKKTTSIFACGRQGIAGDCLGSTREIPVSGRYLKRWLLDGPFELDSPGTYRIRAQVEHEIHRKDSTEILDDLRIESEFDVTLHAPQDGELESAYRPFLNDLNNKDVMVRSFAASAIIQHPPPFAEAAILALADDPQLSVASVDGMARLATPAARVKLLQMSSTSSPEYLRQPAIQALNEIGNSDDCQAMLDIGNQSQNWTQGEAFIVSSRICKGQAIPVLLQLLPKADSPLLSYLAAAFENTGSRNAVPPLISLLDNTDDNVRRNADAGLATLTHRRSRYGIADAESANKSRIEWSNWWAAYGNTAPIYGPDQCAAPQPLR
jgi:hypothetical protein